MGLCLFLLSPDCLPAPQSGTVTHLNTSSNMVKELITIEMERDSLQQKWGFTVQGGKDVSLTAKIASVKRFSPADRAGLEKMDYVWTVNGKEVTEDDDVEEDDDSKNISTQVFNMTQPQITSEIVNSKQKMVLQVERGTFIVPSFDEIWPQAGKDRLGKGSKRMGMEYILEVRMLIAKLRPAEVQTSLAGV